MFSDHLRQDIDALPRLSPAMLAGALVIFCQVVALSFIVEGQVEKADAREQQRLAQQAALAECVERNTGPLRHGCIQQVQAALDVAQAAALRSAPPANGLEPMRAAAPARVAEAAIEAGTPRALPMKLITAN